MNVYQHALISFIAGLAVSLTIQPEKIFEITAVALVAGTLIDLDHFLISRKVHGEWRFLKGVLRSPVKVIFDVQSVIKSEEEFEAELRYITHSIENLIFIGLTIIYGGILLKTAALTTGLHLLSDLLADQYMW